MAAEQINEQKYHEVWTKPVIRMGMITMLLASALSFVPLVYLYMVHGVLPPFAQAMTAWVLVASVFGAFYVVEPISYYPILGLAGTYISFLSGNISNLRLPCSAMAQEVVGVEEGTKQAEIIGTMGIIGSVGHPPRVPAKRLKSLPRKADSPVKLPLLIPSIWLSLTSI